jgi:molecular chaperone DnaK (HSP70)
MNNEVRPSRVPGVIPADLEKKVAGLDFGITKTLAAFPRTGGGIYFFPSPSSSPLPDSLVTLRKDMSYVVGRRQANGFDGDFELKDAKRLVGCDTRFQHLGLSLSVTDAIAMVLNSVRRNIQDKLGKVPSGVVASYPVNFDTRQIE